MNQTNMGISPALFEAARNAAESLLGDNSLTEVELSDFPGFFVVLAKEKTQCNNIALEFKFRECEFILYEKGDT